MSPNFTNLTTPIGTLVFGTLTDPRENPNNGKLEWNAGFVLPTAECEGLLGVIEDALTDMRSRKSTFPATNDKLHFPYRLSNKRLENGEREEDPDKLLWNFKRNAERRSKTGETTKNTPPNLYDANGKVVTGTVPRVPSGSTGRFVYDVYVYDMPGMKGVSFQIKGFQIAQLKEISLDLPPIEGGWVPDDTEVDAIASVLGG